MSRLSHPRSRRGALCAPAYSTTVFGLPSISEEFNRKLNAAAKAGERDAIEREASQYATNKYAPVCPVCGKRGPCNVCKKQESK